MDQLLCCNYYLLIITDKRLKSNVFALLCNRIAWVVFFGFFLPRLCNAQQGTTYKPVAGITFSNAAVKDKGMSALTYTGWYPGVMVGVDISSQELKQSITLGFASGNLKNDQNGATLAAKFFAANYLALFPLNQHKVQLSLGGVFNNSLATRKHSSYINNKSYYEFSSSLGVAARVSYFFNGPADGKETSSLSIGISSPLVSALSRSNSVYNSKSDFLSPGFKTYLKNTHIVTFGRYARVNLHTQLDNRAGALKGLSVGYGWEYYHITEVNQVQSAVNTITLSYHF
jgi:hypothetical protein